MSNVQRPNMAGGTGHQMPGSFSPSGGRPNLNQPTSLPGNTNVANRPNIRPPSNINQTQRPSLPSQGLGNINNLSKPGGMQQPTPLPGNVNRPSLGNVNRPTTLPGTVDRPGIGGNGTVRPNLPQRPIVGGNRPGSSNVNIGNVNVGNNVFAGNRPNWDHGNWNRPGWGIGQTWNNNWHDHCIHDHFPWYNGCWHGHWGSNWYRPFAWGAVGWGLASWTNGWGYGTNYYNPYDVQGASMPYDYSQPVVINNYVSSDDGGNATAPAVVQPSQQGLDQFDQGLKLFKQKDYKSALASFDAALKLLPGDPVVHEVRSLTLFALGDYHAAGAALNSFLSSAPGMDWTTMSSLYDSLDEYTSQLRKLEQFCATHPQDAAAYFVLAYHYLTTDATDDAIGALKVVVKQQPKDATAKRMLDSLLPSSPVTAETPPTPGTMPEIDLVGTWRGFAGDATVVLTISEDFKFTWIATQSGKQVAKLTGQVQLDGNALALENKEQGEMSGNVTTTGSNAWQFAATGAPPGTAPLNFVRAK
jgi:tetratricopeptide (TPR) repeat protein